MRVSTEDLEKAWQESKILPYEPELLERLRAVNFHDVPVSIVILSRPMCLRECYAMSMNLTRGMDHFKLVHGNVNFLSKNESYPNHSWVERDGYVYDTTDGFRWDKELYYELFQPEICEVYDENSVKDYADYQRLLSMSNDGLNLESRALAIQYIELLEQEKPYVNEKYLFNEIEIWRSNNNFTKRFTGEVMTEYKKILKKLMEKH